MKRQAALFASILLVSAFASGCTQQTPSPGNGSPPATFSLEEVANHASVDDCWLVLQGKVYNATGFITNHPGRDAILQGCGKDATTLFETRPMGSGSPHSPNARVIADSLYIGDLK